MVVLTTDRTIVDRHVGRSSGPQSNACDCTRANGDFAIDDGDGHIPARDFGSRDRRLKLPKRRMKMREVLLYRSKTSRKRRGNR